ncbi:hypothetical protein GCK32_014006 [Trichostrongylus colubriformis]|uniref:Uncharacterized protein n=1 Tax=Trichostrongylus colubriformis TaxID=6319 RepID=A0AAN8EVG9_TRICO
MIGGLLLLLVLVFISVPLESREVRGEYDKFYEAFSREVSGKVAPDYSMESIRKQWEARKKRVDSIFARYNYVRTKFEAIISVQGLDRRQRNARLLLLKKHYPGAYKGIVRLYLRKKRHRRQRRKRLTRFRRRLKKHRTGRIPTKGKKSNRN